MKKKSTDVCHSDLEIKTNFSSQNGISTKSLSLYGIKNPYNAYNVIGAPNQRKKEDVFNMINEAEFVPLHKSMTRNVPFDLNRKLADLLVYPRYKGTFVMAFFESIANINSVTFKSVAEKVMVAVGQQESRLNLKRLTASQVTHDMFDSVQSKSLKQYVRRFVDYAQDSAKGES
ncbi:hypothetical protein [Paenibacillus sp. NRS-1760]|uniref:hypothetical protein n=1 Tax=Paenibacillus sp. NRS-1760 TaxID=3233902 RepID=UPI003D2CED18